MQIRDIGNNYPGGNANPAVWLHVGQEAYYPGQNSSLQKATNTFLKHFINGTALPHGNIFNLFK